MSNEKELYSVNRRLFWRLMRNIGETKEIDNIIKTSYEGMTCIVIQVRLLSDTVEASE
ncbi:hypothetical protein DPMN_162512 [Dreissena polymorpha]|uniref:Uncharacterized protein n=1 Tax=Dreissena polymorpha TaxID=45954 RepID=A0A9D4EPP0_DREPO|nr:hypothetical protein DPMN_162512 [Dreissena polymorpha]